METPKSSPLLCACSLEGVCQPLQEMGSSKVTSGGQSGAPLLCSLWFPLTRHILGLVVASNSLHTGLLKDTRGVGTRMEFCAHGQKPPSTPLSESRVSALNLYPVYATHRHIPPTSLGRSRPPNVRASNPEYSRVRGRTIEHVFLCFG